MSRNQNSVVGRAPAPSIHHIGIHIGGLHIDSHIGHINSDLSFTVYEILRGTLQNLG